MCALVYVSYLKYLVSFSQQAEDNILLLPEASLLNTWDDTVKTAKQDLFGLSDWLPSQSEV